MYDNLAGATTSGSISISGNMSGMTTKAPRDVGAIGMAANRVRSVNNAVDQFLTRARIERGRINAEPSGAATADSPQPSPDHSISGLNSELDVLEKLVAQLPNVVAFLETL